MDHGGLPTNGRVLALAETTAMAGGMGFPGLLVMLLALVLVLLLYLYGGEGTGSTGDVTISAYNS